MDRSPTGRMLQASGADRGFVTREIAGELLIVPISGRVGDLEAIYTLNPVGSRIWHLLERPRGVHEVIDAIADEYDVTADEAAADVAAFLDELEQAGLVRTIEAGVRT